MYGLVRHQRCWRSVAVGPKKLSLQLQQEFQSSQQLCRQLAQLNARSVKSCLPGSAKPVRPILLALLQEQAQHLCKERRSLEAQLTEARMTRDAAIQESATAVASVERKLAAAAQEAAEKQAAATREAAQHRDRAAALEKDLEYVQDAVKVSGFFELL